nr:OB-fold nucleic acid binding domain-containing protein [Colletotrichum truncatum]KAF6797700.1 OB-fold nucleic acid binding domain-containing protein [Colletotrichum truncatum]
MTGDSPAGLYPQYCLHLSPTFNTWCLLHASDIHALRSVPDFAVQDFYFYNNLPIKWVRIVGIIVAIDDFPGRRIYTVDDSSGACIECTVALKTPSASLKTSTTTDASNALLISNRPQPQPPADCSGLEVGSVVDIKGGVATFREEKQIKIEKVKVLRATEQEVALWERRTQFRNEVLLEPWVLSEKQIRRCKKEEMREKGDGDERKRKKEKRHEEKKRAKDDEKRRNVRDAATANDADLYRIHKFRKSKRLEERRVGSSGGLLRHVLDESLRGKYSALGL